MDIGARQLYVSSSFDFDLFPSSMLVNRDDDLFNLIITIMQQAEALGARRSLLVYLFVDAGVLDDPTNAQRTIANAKRRSQKSQVFVFVRG